MRYPVLLAALKPAGFKEHLGTARFKVSLGRRLSVLVARIKPLQCHLVSCQPGLGNAGFLQTREFSQLLLSAMVEK